MVRNRQTWTVLITVAAVGPGIVVMSLWFVTALLLRWRFQYGIRSLMLLTVAVAVVCSWLAIEMRSERRQREATEAIKKAGGRVSDVAGKTLARRIVGDSDTGRFSF